MSYIKVFLLIFCITLYSLQNAIAQLYSDDTYWTTSWLRKEKLTANFENMGHILLKGSLQYNSTAVSNDFITQALYNQATVSEKDARFSVDRLQDHNSAGLDGNASVSGAAVLGADKSFMLDAGISYRDLSALDFTRDLFKLTFENYIQYNNKDAIIGATHMREYNYSSMFLGAQKALSKHFILGARISVIKGGYYQEVNIGEGTLRYSADFNNPYGEINAPFEYYSQKRMANPFAADNGWGGGLDLYTRVCFNKAVFTAEVRDLGFINWKNMDAYIGDQATYKFDETNVTQLFIPNNINDPSPDDVANQLGIDKQTVNRMTTLPTKIQLGYLQKFSKHIALKTDVNYMFVPGYKPYGKLAAFVSLANSAFFISPAVAAGGFGKINSQLSIGVTVAQTWTLQLNAMAFEYLLAREIYSGHGLDLVIAKSFRSKNKKDGYR